MSAWSARMPAAEAEEGAPGALPRECLRAAVQSLLAHRLRSALTALGVVIAVAALILIAAVMQGLAQLLTEQFQGMGGSLLTVRADNSLEETLQGRVHRLTGRDLAALRAQAPAGAELTPLVSLGGAGPSEVKSGRRTALAKVFGTTDRYERVQNSFVARGRFLTLLDERSRRRVCVIGEKTRRDLGLPADATGRFILIAGEWLKIVGVMEARGELFGISQDDFVLLPYATALALRGPEPAPDLWIFVALPPQAEVEAAKAQLASALRASRGLAPGAKADFRIESSEQVARTFSAIAAAVTAVLGSLVGLALLVGGIGIMNVMLMTVAERTREIGLAKALGATRQHILCQFLAEAVILALAGGAAGLAIGIGLAQGVAALVPGLGAAAAPWWAVAGSLLFCSAVGLVFGVAPAARAAALSPIQALRRDQG